MPEGPLSKIKNFQVFDSSEGLDDFVVKLMMEDFSSSGLVLLPAGGTFEEGIYPKLNDYFSSNSPHPELRLSHLDERVSMDKNHLLGEAIRSSLPALCSSKQEFLFIDKLLFAQKSRGVNLDAIANTLEKFDSSIKSDGGPKSIYGGLGKDPKIAHFAFIGEEGINKTTAHIKLSPSAQLKSEKGDAVEAITIGTDIVSSPNLQNIYVVMKGNGKATSLKAAVEDSKKDSPTTGLGWIIKHHPEKLNILADKPAVSKLI